MATNQLSFVQKVHRILEDASVDGFDDVISWTHRPNGKTASMSAFAPRLDAFCVHKPTEFGNDIMPLYFTNSTKYRSFQRQLSYWGFSQIERGPQKGSYYHELFVREEPLLCLNMQTTRRRTKKPTAPDIKLNGASVASASGMDTPSSLLFVGPEFQADPEKVGMAVDTTAAEGLPCNLETGRENLLQYYHVSDDDHDELQEADTSSDGVELDDPEDQPMHLHDSSFPSRKKEKKQAFPFRLYQLLEDAASFGFENVVSWNGHSSSFRVHNKHEFTENIMPLYFPRSTMYRSFQRNLNYYGFQQRSKHLNVPQNDAYSHPLFVRGQPSLCQEFERSTQTQRGGNEQAHDPPAKCPSTFERSEEVVAAGTRNVASPTTTVDMAFAAAPGSMITMKATATAVPEHISRPFQGASKTNIPVKSATSLPAQGVMIDVLHSALNNICNGDDGCFAPVTLTSSSQFDSGNGEAQPPFSWETSVKAKLISDELRGWSSEQDILSTPTAQDLLEEIESDDEESNWLL